MCEQLDWFFSALANVPWLELMKAAGPFATAGVAWVALRNWQRQDKAKREAEYLDLLVESAQNYLAALAAPIAQMSSLQAGLGFDQDKDQGQFDEDPESKKLVRVQCEVVGGLIAQPMEKLLETQSKFISLVAKGAIFRFSRFDRLQAACGRLAFTSSLLEVTFDRVTDVSRGLDGPQLLGALKYVQSFSVDVARDNRTKANEEIMEFAKGAYKKIYG